MIAQQMAEMVGGGGAEKLFKFWPFICPCSFPSINLTLKVDYAWRGELLASQQTPPIIHIHGYVARPEQVVLGQVLFQRMQSKLVYE